MAMGDRGGKGGGAYRVPMAGGHSPVNNKPMLNGEQAGMPSTAGRTPYAKPTSNYGAAKHTNGKPPIAKAGGNMVYTKGNGTGPKRYNVPKPGKSGSC